MSDLFWSEIYDSKQQRTEKRQKGAFRICDKCKEWQGHSIDCPEVTIESINNLLQRSRKNEEHAKEQAGRWLNQLKAAIGKIAILRHENNKLRAANKKLRDSK